jgi:hypothetical protein
MTDSPRDGEHVQLSSTYDFAPGLAAFVLVALVVGGTAVHLGAPEWVALAPAVAMLYGVAVAERGARFSITQAWNRRARKDRHDDATGARKIIDRERDAKYEPPA